MSSQVVDGFKENRGVGTDGVHLVAQLANTLYAVLGIRLQGGVSRAVINRFTMVSETNDDFEAILLLNPTVAGTFTYVVYPNTVLEVARGVTANTVTGGTPIDYNESKTTQNSTSSIRQLVLPSQSYVLCVRPFSNNANIHASIRIEQ